MTDTFNTGISIQLQEEDNNITRFFNDTFSAEPNEYRNGKMNIEPGVTDQILCENFVSYKIGSIGATPYNGKCFLHNGEQLSIYISNNGLTTVNVEYVCMNNI